MNARLERVPEGAGVNNGFEGVSEVNGVNVIFSGGTSATAEMEGVLEGAGVNAGLKGVPEGAGLNVTLIQLFAAKSGEWALSVVITGFNFSEFLCTDRDRISYCHVIEQIGAQSTRKAELPYPVEQMCVRVQLQQMFPDTFPAQMFEIFMQCGSWNWKLL